MAFYNYTWERLRSSQSARARVLAPEPGFVCDLVVLGHVTSDSKDVVTAHSGCSSCRQRLDGTLRPAQGRLARSEGLYRRDAVL